LSTKHLKRTVASAVAIGLASIALLGCSGSSGGDSKTLVVWDPFSTYGANTAESNKAYLDLVAEVDADFKKTHKGVKIEHQHFAYDGYDTRLAAAVAAGNAPDVAWQFGDLSWQITDPLDDRLTSAQRDDLTLIDQSIVSAQDRKLHILPIGTYQGVWMYNKAIFAKAGAEVPKTQEQFLQDCKEITSAGYAPTQISFGLGHKVDRYVALYAGQLIGDIDKWNAGDIAYTSAQYKDGFEALLTAKDAGCYGKDPAGKGTAGDTMSTFLAGTSAMAFAAEQIDVTEIEKSIGKGNLGVFLQPQLPDGKGQSMDASLQAGVTLLKTSKNKDLAWEYMSLWASPAMQELAWEKVNALPNSVSAKVTATNEVDQQRIDWAQSKDPLFKVGAWPINNTESEAHLQMGPSVVSGQLSLNEFLSRMQDVRESSKK
jgi:raffinose/stachyose/melibiose transport system substrate-binding protein